MRLSLVLFLGVAVAVAGIFLTIKTTGGTPWKIGISVGTGVLSLSFLAASIGLFVSMKKTKPKEISLEEALKNSEKNFNFIVSLTSENRKPLIQIMDDNKYKLFILFVLTEYFDDEDQRNSTPLPEGLYNDLKAKQGWDTLAGNAGASSSFLTLLNNS